MDRPKNPGWCGPRARLTKVGAKSTWPTGVAERRGRRPGTRTMNGTLVWGEYR